MACDGLLLIAHKEKKIALFFNSSLVLKRFKPPVLSSTGDKKHENVNLMYTLLIQYNYHLNKINLNMDLVNTKIPRINGTIKRNIQT